MARVDAAPGTRLLLVRHGETEWNREQRVQGHHDVTLTARGIEQAQVRGEWLSDEDLRLLDPPRRSSPNGCRTRRSTRSTAVISSARCLRRRSWPRAAR